MKILEYKIGGYRVRFSVIKEKKQIDKVFDGRLTNSEDIQVIPVTLEGRYRCDHCGYKGLCYGVPTGAGVSAPFCRKCGKNDKLIPLWKEENS